MWQIWRIEADGIRRPIAQSGCERQAERWGDLLAMALYPARIEVTEAD